MLLGFWTSRKGKFDPHLSAGCQREPKREASHIRNSRWLMFLLDVILRQEWE